MKKDSYSLNLNLSFDSYSFVSKGTKGDIIKTINFTQIGKTDVYNLGFGDMDSQTGEIDDLIISNNEDRDIVIATVAKAVYEYTKMYPARGIIFSGSSPARTRLYRIAIAINFEELSKDFDIYGIIGRKPYTFETGKEYEAFYAIRKPGMIFNQ